MSDSFKLCETCGIKKADIICQTCGSENECIACFISYHDSVDKQEHRIIDPKDKTEEPKQLQKFPKFKKLFYLSLANRLQCVNCCKSAKYFCIDCLDSEHICFCTECLPNYHKSIKDGASHRIFYFHCGEKKLDQLDFLLCDKCDNCYDFECKNCEIKFCTLCVKKNHQNDKDKRHLLLSFDKSMMTVKKLKFN